MIPATLRGGGGGAGQKGEEGKGGRRGKRGGGGRREGGGRKGMDLGHTVFKYPQSGGRFSYC